jgi:thymidine kinase
MLEVITGCMYSGKSEELIRRLRRCQIAGQNLIAFKSGLDDRYSKDLATHPVEGVPSTLPAINVQSLAELREHMSNNLGSPLVVGFDEVQFMEPAIIDFLEDEANKGHRVIVAGLDLDSNGKPFGPMAELLARADKVTKLTAVCVAPHPERTVCGKAATRSYRLPEADTGERVQVGSAGVYEARCRACWAGATPNQTPISLETP